MSGLPPVPEGGFLGALERAAEALVGNPACDWFERVVADVANGQARSLDEAMLLRGCDGAALDRERRARRDAALHDIWRHDYRGMSAQEAATKIKGDLRRYAVAGWLDDRKRCGVLPRDIATARHRLWRIFSSGAHIPTCAKTVRRILKAGHGPPSNVQPIMR